MAPKRPLDLKNAPWWGTCPTARITELEDTPNETVRLTMGVAPTVNKLREKRLGWFGHVLRWEDSHPAKQLLLRTEVEGRRLRGRPQLRWMDKIHADLKELRIIQDPAFDRRKWKNITTCAVGCTSRSPQRAQRVCDEYFSPGKDVNICDIAGDPRWPLAKSPHGRQSPTCASM
ncbi:hypothetical protein M514_07814, partial [Trichuris suis]